ISTGTTLRGETAPTIPHMALLARLRRPLPARDGRLAHARNRELSRGRVLGERGPGAQRRAAADAHRRDELGVRADEDVVLDDRAVLVGAVVVAGDGAGADVDVPADLAVADVGEMVGLGARADAARLHLDEVADVHVPGEHGAGPDARVRAETAVRPDLGLVEVAEGLDARARPDLDVPQHAVRADADAVAQLHPPLEHAVDVDRDVAAALERPAHVDARRVGERHAALEQRPGDVALVHALELGELRTAVDAEHFPRRSGRHPGDGDVLVDGELHDVGEVVLLLGIVVPEAREPALQLRGRRHHDARVHLADRALLVARVPLFDDARDAPAAAHDAPVALGVVEL